jgi:hypothetical protein
MKHKVKSKAAHEKNESKAYEKKEKAKKGKKC